MNTDHKNYLYEFYQKLIIRVRVNFLYETKRESIMTFRDKATLVLSLIFSLSTTITFINFYELSTASIALGATVSLLTIISLVFDFRGKSYNAREQAKKWKVAEDSLLKLDIHNLSEDELKSIDKYIRIEIESNESFRNGLLYKYMLVEFLKSVDGTNWNLKVDMTILEKIQTATIPKSLWFID